VPKSQIHIRNIVLKKNIVFRINNLIIQPDTQF
jgi:hypothetical protein